MQMKVTCPKCGKELRAPPEVQGKRVACPRCNEGFRVSAPTDSPPESPTPVSVRMMPAPVPVRTMPPPVNRRAEAAKFIADEAAETRVQLGADGRLPSLQFQSRVAEQDPQEPHARDSNPLLLIGVLCFSITLSVILLVLEPQQGPSNVAAKDEARRAILESYTGLDPQLMPDERRLRERLREALEAFHRDDYASERRLYREALNMLKNESNRGARGLTGPRQATMPPNDEHLEQQLATLLSGD